MKGSNACEWHMQQGPEHGAQEAGESTGPQRWEGGAGKDGCHAAV